MKKVADRAGIGPAQVNRVMYGKGYTIDTLLAILGELDMIIKVEKRKRNEKIQTGS